MNSGLSDFHSAVDGHVVETVSHLFVLLLNHHQYYARLLLIVSSFILSNIFTPLCTRTVFKIHKSVNLAKIYNSVNGLKQSPVYLCIPLKIAVPKSASTPDLSRTGFYWSINTRISHTSHVHVCQQAVTTCADDTLVLYKTTHN